MSFQLFDQDGMLILPQDTVNEFWSKVKKKTGVFVLCECGNEWERMNTNGGKIRCSKCGKYKHVGRIERKGVPA